jgi:ABC-type Fe3+-siderophore transport system permease subunit
MTMKSPQPTRWLWWLAFVIAIATTLIVFFIRQDEGNIDAREQASKVIMFATIAIGICIISATSNLWIKR